MDELTLVRRARTGDTMAFAALVRRHQDAIVRLATRMVGPDEAEDVAQRAFLKAWQGLVSFEAQGGATFGTWLYRIAINCCHDALRHAARYRTVPLEDEALEVADSCDVAEAVVAAAEEEQRLAALTRALMELPTADRTLLALRVDEDLSYDAIAAILDLNPRTVGTRLYRARARLHRLVVAHLSPVAEEDYGLR